MSRAAPSRRSCSPTHRPIALAAALLSLTACGPKSPPPSAPYPSRQVDPHAELSDAPVWVTRGCRAYWNAGDERRRRLCAVGSAVASRNRVAARETAVARARSAIARSLEVTIESVVRLEDHGGTRAGDDGDLESIVHQLSSASLPACEVVSVWRAPSGEVHALVALSLEHVQRSVRRTASLAPPRREALAQRAAEAFAELDAAFEESR